MGRDSGQDASPRRARWRSTGSAWLRTTPSSRCSRSPRPGCSAACGARRRCAPGSGRPPCDPSRTAARVAAAERSDRPDEAKPARASTACRPALPDGDADPTSAAPGWRRRRARASREAQPFQAAEGATAMDEPMIRVQTMRSADRRRRGDAVDPTAVGEAAVAFMTGLAVGVRLDGDGNAPRRGQRARRAVDGEDLGSADRARWPHADGRPGPGPRRRPAPARRPRDPAADRRRRLPRAAPGGAREVRHRRSPTRCARRAAQGARADGRRPTARSCTTRSTSIEGVASHSDGEEPRRRVVITPADVRYRSVPAPRSDRRLIETLREAQRLGFLGARPVEQAAAHAARFAAALGDRSRRRTPDRSRQRRRSARAWCSPTPSRSCSIMLVDRRQKRTDFLQRAVRAARASIMSTVR